MAYEYGISIYGASYLALAKEMEGRVVYSG
jgi:predicted nucleic acid-binding protein